MSDDRERDFRTYAANVRHITPAHLLRALGFKESTMSTETVGQILENDPVVLKRVIELGELVRTLQRDFFKTRDPQTLVAAKRAEKQFDAAIAALKATRLL